MQVILSQHDDFKNEKNALETMLESRGHVAVFLPKFHCELNGIERVWGHSKRTTRAYCDYTITSLRENGLTRFNPPRNYPKLYTKIQELYVCLFGWKYTGVRNGEDDKKFSKEYKSHRRVGEND